MAIDNETMQIIERCVARAVGNAASIKDAAGEIAKGVTQYVGSRYVPLFAEPLEWSSEREYEPLTIVLYQGASYTSRQYVPVDTAITNEKFWVVTGNYNAQVEQYRRETKAVSDKYDTVVNNSNDAMTLAQENSAKLAGTTDSALKTLITDETARARNEESSIDSKVVAETERAQNAESSIDSKVTAETNRAQNAESSIRQTADANRTSIQGLNENVNQLTSTVNGQGSLINSINSKFPIASDSIADGAVTATKMATSAINSILQGFTVHRFDSKDDEADNTGMICPEGGTLRGFYIEELSILAISEFAGTAELSVEKKFQLPSYVPSVTGIVQMAGLGVITNSTSSAFEHWSGLRYGKGRYIFPNSSYKQPFSSVGTVLAYLKPYATSTQSASYSNAIQDNQIV